MTTNRKSPWFFHEAAVTIGESVQLADEEARHLSGSRRMEVGGSLTLFDGRGHTANATVNSVGNRGRGVAVTIHETRFVEPPAMAIHLASALPKGDRLSVMLDMATQLGVSSFTPLECERSVVKASDNARLRWHRIMIEACKQSRQAYVPELRDVQKPAAVASRATGNLWLAHPGGLALRSLAPITEGALTILIGPEGGFTDEEVAAITDAGGQTVSLGVGILRTESAAVSLLAYARIAYGGAQ
jgi:16S rRNA (uracil1498-N3)-methyltransferase